MILSLLVKRGLPAALYTGVGLFALDTAGPGIGGPEWRPAGHVQYHLSWHDLIPLIQGAGGMRQLKKPGGTIG